MLSAFHCVITNTGAFAFAFKPTVKNKETKWPYKFFYLFNNWFGKLTDKYSDGVNRSIKASRYVIILLVCMRLWQYFYL